MNNNLFQLEFLPNEVFIDIFQFFQSQDLFRAFYNLNSRFNTLLQSLNNLSLTLLTFDSNESNDYDIFTPYIQILNLGYRVDINLNTFINVRRLHVYLPSCEQLKQLESVSLPYLECLSIGHRHILLHNKMPDLCNKIFSNGFPHLKSCCLLEPRIIHTLPCLTQSTQLSILKVHTINFSSYQMIISVCPQLYLFKFTIEKLYNKSLFIEPHKNLKRMIITFAEYLEPLDDCDIDSYFSCVPNLEQLCVRRMDIAVNIEKYLNYNWLALFIDCHLSSLRQLKFYFYFAFAGESLRYDSENILYRIEENFKHMHNDRYQSQLILDLTKLLYCND